MVDVVRRQNELGIDVPGDGEFGKAMGHRSTTAPGGATPSIGWAAWISNGPGLYEHARAPAPRPATSC